MTAGDIRKHVGAADPSKETEPRRRTRLRVLFYLRQLRGEAGVEVLPDLRIRLPLTTGDILVDVHPAGHEDGLVRFSTNLGPGRDPDPEVLRQLLSANNRETLIGAYAMDKDRRILFRHHVLGAAMDRDAIRAILETFDAITRGRPSAKHRGTPGDTAPGVPDPTVPMETRPWLGLKRGPDDHRR